MEQQLAGDDVQCSVCRNIFACRNHAGGGVWGEDGWICGECEGAFEELESEIAGQSNKDLYERIIN